VNGQSEVVIEMQLVVDDAVEAMVLVQGLDVDSLAAKDLHAAVTLARAARSRIARLVADARDEQVSWSQIASILGMSRLWAALRHGPFVHRRRTPMVLD
jgi:hypothetical protein